MQRIDAWTDLAIQLFYLAALTAMLIYPASREARTLRAPGP
jgi:hypothetical protein